MASPAALFPEHPHLSQEHLLNRPSLRAPKSLRRRPYRARRAVIAHVPLEYSPERTAPRRLIALATGLAALVVVELIVGLAVIA